MTCPSNPGSLAFSYVYDRYGNRWQQNVTAGTGPQPQYSFDANNRITASVYTFDAAGNIMNDGVHGYTYDGENRIVKVDTGSTALYSYDAEGRRVAKSVVTSGTQLEYLFDLSGRAVTEIQAGTTTTNRSEVYAAGRHLVTQNVALGTSYFIHTDWLGTERARTDLSGNLAESCTSLAYGDSLTCTGTDVSPLHFTGKMHDNETGLDEFPARYYSSGIGRWYSPDWASAQVPVPYADLHSPQTLNLYDYVGSDPTNHPDADGHLQSAPNQGAANACATNPQCAKDKQGQGSAQTAAQNNNNEINTKPPTPKAPPIAELKTDMQAHTTTFLATDKNDKLSVTQIETRTDVTKKAKPGADDPYTTHNIDGVSNRHAGEDAYGPAGAFIDTGDSRGRDIHGGGTGLPDPMAPQQGWKATLGCSRGQNEDVVKLGNAIKQFQHANPDVVIPYVRQ